MIELDTSWHARALCRTLQDDTFFPEKSEKTKAKEAQQICSRCPVREQCEAFATETNQRWGIWGGKSPHARKQPRLYLGGGIG